MFENREYRIYMTGKLATLSRNIECANDDTAVEQARRLFPNGLVEVWHGNRLVSRIEKVAAK